MSPTHPKSPANRGYGTISSSSTQSSSDTDSLESSSPHGTDYKKRKDYQHGREPSFDRVRRKSFIEEDGDPLQIEPPTTKKKHEPVTWSSLPHRGQLAILTMSRLSEPLVQSSLRSYLWYQLKSFDRSLPDSTIASQAGIMQGAFAAAQLCTAMLWGRFSDKAGRKRILLIGLSGTMLSCIGFGFSTKFWQALVFRMLGGALNGNVGVMRTMISEIVREKKFQSRAFLLLPMCANIGVIIGPLLGGLTSDPAGQYPSLFSGNKWLEKYPYSPPNIISAIFLCCAFLTVFFGLEETHEAYAFSYDIGVHTRRKISRFLGRLFSSCQPTFYAPVSEDDTDGTVVKKPNKLVAPHYPNKLPFRRIFTHNVICTLLCHGLAAGCIGTFNNIWYNFLSTPVYDPSNPPPNYTPHPPLIFTGGIGLPPASVGFAMAILGTIGITLQLFFYPAINARLGTIRSWRIVLYCFPVVYALIPFLALIPSTNPPPGPKTGPLIWSAITVLTFIQVVGRTFATPATSILLNNCSPHPSVLGTIHGIGQSASSAARTVGPAMGGFLYGLGLKYGVVGAVFWGLTGVAVLSIVASGWVREGDGHEIRLEGDDEAEEAAERENKALLEAR